jgi:hypothetical protein
MLVTDVGMFTLVNLHARNAPSPMFVTELGIDISSRELHPEKANSLMLVKDEGMVMDVHSSPLRYRAYDTAGAHDSVLFMAIHLSKSAMSIRSILHLEKQFLPILVTDTGIFTLFKLLHPKNAQSPIVVTL